MKKKSSPKTAVFYSFNSQKTAKAAAKVIETLKAEIEVNAENAEILDAKTFLAYDVLILAVPTWFDGELPNYWDEFVPEIEELDLKGKKVAIFGPGDQKGYSENFVDGIGIMAELIEDRGGQIIGFTSVDGYSFERSRAVRGNTFCGLALDFENQPRLNTKRITDWCKQLLGEI